MDNLLWKLYSIVNSPLIFLVFAVIIKCLLISFYSLLLYGAILAVKKVLSGKIGVRANYYIWYALLLSIPLAGFGWNDAVKVPLYGLFLSSWGFINGSIIHRGHLINLGITLFCLGIVLIKLISRIIVGNRICKSISQMDAYIDKDGLVQQAATALGLQAKQVNVVISDTIRSPVSYGVLNKFILLPQDYDTRYSLSELYLLLLHEMAHLKNHDTMKLHFIAYAESFLWVLPLFLKPFKRDTEILCDNRVIGIQDNPDTYGKLLLKESANKSAVKGIAFSDSYRTISRRLHALKDYRPEKHRMAFFAVAVFALMLFAFGWSYWHPSGWFYINDFYQSDFIVKIEYAAEEFVNIQSGESSSISEDILLPAEEFEEFIEEIDGAGQTEFVEMVQRMEQLPLNTAFDSIYEVADGALRVDKIALYEAVKPFEGQETPITSVRFEYLYAVLDIGYIEQESISSYTFDIHELASANENDRYAVRPLRKNSLEDIVYLIVAHWG